MTGLGHNLRFSKREKLTGKKRIEELFKNGSSFYLAPVLMKVDPIRTEGAITHQVLFTVSKRNFKRAVDRNRIKRQMREAYRLNRHLLDQIKLKGLLFKIAFVYIHKKETPYQQIATKLKNLLCRLQDSLQQEL